MSSCADGQEWMYKSRRCNCRDTDRQSGHCNVDRDDSGDKLDWIGRDKYDGDKHEHGDDDCSLCAVWRNGLEWRNVVRDWIYMHRVERILLAMSSLLGCP